MSQFISGHGQALVRASVAAILGTATIGYMPSSLAAEEAAKPAASQEVAELEEVRVTGSRIVRKDMKSNSPLVTIDRQQLEDSSFISLEEALNDLPQFMVGGATQAAGTTTGLQAANNLDGGKGSGDMMNMGLLPDNAGVIGVVVPGAANVNLRGLGANRSLTLIDGHRAMPLNATMTVDMNTIPAIAVGGIELITGGASAVYGADALAGVTNIKFRDNFEGMNARFKAGINEAGDGEEYQVSTLIGGKFGSDKGHAMVGLEYSRRDESLWRKRNFLREVMESPYSNSSDYIFGWEPFYSAGGTAGTYNVLSKTWSGNSPSTPAILSVFSDRNCSIGGVLQNCVADGTNAPRGGGWFFNPDGTLYTRASQVAVGSGATASTNYYGPQSYNLTVGGTPQNPSEVVCSYFAALGGVPATGATLGTAQVGPFAGQPCSPTTNRVDYGRWLTLPREAYTMFGRATFEFNDHVTAFTNFHFASSDTETRREPAPFSGGFGAIIPFHTSQGGDAVYLPSLVQVPTAGLALGTTRPEYRVGGTKGTNCAPTGGCTMAQAFPLPGDTLTAAGAVTTAGELRQLLESRPLAAAIGTTGVNATNPFRGLSSCNQYNLAANTGAPGALVNPTGGASYQVAVDPNTGQMLANCGPNSGWQVNTQLGWMPPRGTHNTERLYQFEFGLRGDMGLGDWTWETYVSHGDAQTQTSYDGFSSLANYMKIMSAPNYGKGFIENGLSSKYMTCTSGINPFDQNLVVSQDCIDAISSNQIDRNSMTQRVYEANAQGGIANLPAGQIRGAVGATYRRNAYRFTPDSLRERDYVGDTSAGQFASGDINQHVSVKEIYGEALVPVLKDLPGVNSLELELGLRSSKYSTGQTVDTYKVLASWEPIDWLRVRGGYNRAERAPNMSELYATPSGSSSFASAATDPCRNDTTLAGSFPGPTAGSTLNNTSTTDTAVRQQLQALCGAQINAWGGAGSEWYSTYSASNPAASTWNVAGGGALIVGNPDIKSEKGDTWTIGIALRSPFEHALLRKATATVDWYEVRVSDPIEVIQTAQIVNSCFNVNGLNPTFALDDPLGYCKFIERDPSTSAIVRVLNNYGNQGKLVIRGIDTNFSWSAKLSDMGFANAPGTLSINMAANYLIDQIQRYGATGFGDYAGFGGASRLRGNTTFAYNWGDNRVSLNWQYRLGTHTPTVFATAAAAAPNGTTSPTLNNNPLLAGYHTNNFFHLTAGRRFGDLNASFTVNNLLGTKPKAGGYDFRDPWQGYGTFSPFDDLIGRRYSINLSMDF